MSVRLVFIHGRSQEFRDPADLIREWRAGLNAGLTRSDRRPLLDEPITFPFYGNELYRVTAALARSGASLQLEALPADRNEPGPLHPDTSAEVGQLERDLIAEMASAASVRPVHLEGLDDLLSWGPARNALNWLARTTRVDQTIISTYLKDVAVYLIHAREPILQIVRDSIQKVPTTTPLVLVTHSLGTVVARDLLDDLDLRRRTRLWVCAGSPLGLDAVQKNLKTKGAVNPGVPWLSAYDVNDIVALGNPLHRTWGSPLTDVEVENGQEPHSITKYLGHPEVAGQISDALSRP